MHAINADQRDTHSLSGDPGRVDSSTGAHPTGRRWQPDWWASWLAPTPSWLERLERGTPLPGLLRR